MTLIMDLGTPTIAPTDGNEERIIVQSGHGADTANFAADEPKE